METYEAPEIIEVGTVESLTEGNAVGEFTDADFPTNTPRSQLTFS